MSHKTGSFVYCEICGKKEWRKGFHVRKVKHYFCSRRHAYDWRIKQTQKKFPRSVIRKLYVSQKKTYRQISTILRVNARTVRRLLEHYKIPIRRGGEAVKVQWVSNDKRRESQAIRFVNNVSQKVIPTKTEKEVMDYLKERKIDFVFQYVVHRYMLDFAIIDRKIDIEIDGREHKFDPDRRMRDKKRDAWLARNGWHVIRFNSLNDAKNFI